MSCVEKRAEIVKRSIVRINIEIIGDVIAVVAQWRRIKRQQPNGGDAKFLEIIELLDQAAKIADAVAIAVVKCFDVQLVDDRVLVPKGVGHCLLSSGRHAVNLCRTKRAAQSSVHAAVRSTSRRAARKKKAATFPWPPLVKVNSGLALNLVDLRGYALPLTAS